MTETTANPLAVALAKAQGEMQNAIINKENPHFKSRYADLASIRDATVPFLSKHGLAIYHVITQIAQPEGHLQWIVQAELVHGESGAAVTSQFPLPNAFDRPQVMGSAITYGKRYTWGALCGIATEEDDDANVAEADAKNAKPAAAPKKPAPDIIKPPPIKPQTMQSVIGPDDDEATTPHLITDGWDEGSAVDYVTWGKKLLDTLRACTDAQEADAWMAQNKEPLAAMEKGAGKVYARLNNAILDIYTLLKDAENG